MLCCLLRREDAEAVVPDVLHLDEVRQGCLARHWSRRPLWPDVTLVVHHVARVAKERHRVVLNGLESLAVLPVWAIAV